MIRKIILLLLLLSIKIAQSQSYEFKAGFHDRKDSQLFSLSGQLIETLQVMDHHIILPSICPGTYILTNSNQRGIMVVNP